MHVRTATGITHRHSLFAASSAGGDFPDVETDLVFASGSIDGSMECINVTVTQDDSVECEEAFMVDLTLNTFKDSISLGNNSTLVTLKDSDGTAVSHTLTLQLTMSYQYLCSCVLLDSSHGNG